MACVKEIKLNKDNIKGECGNKGGKCDLVYDYPVNTCTVSNQTTYLELTGCGNGGIVSFGTNELKIGLGNLRIYSPAIHNVIDGNDSNNNIVAEAILHYTDTNSKNVLICIPIKKDDTSSDNFWGFLNTVKPQGSKTATNINTTNFTLNNLVTNCPFFQYSGKFPFNINTGACNKDANIIVLDPTDGNIATISTKYLNRLNTLITTWATKSTTITAPSDLFYNSDGAKKPGDGPNSSKVRILSKCVETSNVVPPDLKKKKIKAYLWIVPTAMLCLLVLVAFIFFIYSVTKGKVSSTAVSGTIGGVGSSVATSVSKHKGVTILSIGLVVCIIFIIILSVRSF